MWPSYLAYDIYSAKENYASSLGGTGFVYRTWAFLLSQSHGSQIWQPQPLYGIELWKLCTNIVNVNFSRFQKTGWFFQEWVCQIWPLCAGKWASLICKSHCSDPNPSHFRSPSDRRKGDAKPFYDSYRSPVVALFCYNDATLQQSMVL